MDHCMLVSLYAMHLVSNNVKLAKRLQKRKPSNQLTTKDKTERTPINKKHK